MEMVDDVLYEFKGQLSYTDIKEMTYKELGYLRAHRRKILSDKNNAMDEALGELTGQ